MDNRIILSKIFSLIFLSRQLKIFEHDDLIYNILDKIKSESSSISNNNYIEKLKYFCIELLEIKDSIDINTIKQRLTIILDTDKNLLNSILEIIDHTTDETSVKKTITSLVKLLNNYYREFAIIDLLSKVTYDIKFNRAKISNFNDYIRNLISELEPLTSPMTRIKDPGIVNEIDFENSSEVENTFDEIKKINSNQSILKTGWQALNRLTQGGIRRGEFVTIAALQHKYKTGFSLSLFMQLARYNKPHLKDINKKPLLLRISFEDSLINNLQFMYTYLQANENPEFNPKNIDNLTTKELSNYIISKLTVNGYYIKMLRVDPSQWTYMNVINKILELEANNYEIHVLMLDYITLLPTTGCTVGPVGFDKKDLIRRIRNFCSSRDITVITPLQLSSEAKQLIRNGVPEHQFVNEIAEKGYYDGSKSIDQDIDLELFIHLFTSNRKKYLAVRRGKHRIPTVIDDEDKYFLLRFPGLNIPILEDIDKEDSSLKKLPKESNLSDNILTELM